MKTAHVVIFMLLAGAFACPARGQERQAQVAAATDDARSNLRKAVLDEKISGELSAAALVERASSAAPLEAALDQARQIGGPRWLNDTTVQVRLEVDGASVAHALTEMAAQDPKLSPIAPDVLAGRLREWKQRTFAATGSSLRAEQVGSVRPFELPGAWQNVSELARRDALARAKQDAVDRTMRQVSQISLPDGRPAGEVWGPSGGQERIRQWLNERPVTKVVFAADLEVHVALAAPTDEFFEVFREAVAAAAGDAAGWDAVRGRFVGGLSAVSGSATAAVDVPSAETPHAVELPRAAPSWATGQLDAQGSAQIDTSKLKAARAAEADAVHRLREQVGGLSLVEGLTIEQATRRDPRVARAVDAALQQARTYKVDYSATGQVQVRVGLDLRHVWSALESGQ
jgi:hypothetical protein